MKAMTARNAIQYSTSEPHTSILGQWFKAYAEAYKEAFQENKATILCGIVAAGGNPHMYPVYSQLKETEKTGK